MSLELLIYLNFIFFKPRRWWAKQNMNWSLSIVTDDMRIKTFRYAALCSFMNETSDKILMNRQSHFAFTFATITN